MTMLEQMRELDAKVRDIMDRHGRRLSELEERPPKSIPAVTQLAQHCPAPDYRSDGDPHDDGPCGCDESVALRTEIDRVEQAMLASVAQAVRQTYRAEVDRAVLAALDDVPLLELEAWTAPNATRFRQKVARAQLARLAAKG